MALISTIPGPVLGGVSLLLYGYIATNGLRRIQRGQVDFENPKHIVIMSVMLVTGLGGALWGKGMVQVSGMSMAAIFGIVLNLAIRDYGGSDQA